MTTDPTTSQFARTAAGDIVVEWWHSLLDDRGGRADLRRCRTTLEIHFVPRFQALAQRLPNEVRDDWKANRLAAVAGVLAHVVADLGHGSFAEVLATPTSGDRPPMGDLRFRRLLACESSDDLLTTVRRAVQVAGCAAPVSSLATDLLRWNDRTRKAWAAAYYRRAPAVSSPN